MPDDATALQIDPSAFAEVAVDKNTANVWMHEAGPAAQASWPTAHPDAEKERAKDQAIAAMQPANDTAAPPTGDPVSASSATPSATPAQVGTVPQAAPIRGFGGGYRPQPVQPDFYARNAGEQIHQGAMRALSELDEKYRSGEIDQDAFDKGMDGIEAQRTAELSKLDQFNQSLPGRMLGHERLKMDAQGRQLDIAQRGNEYDAWDASQRGKMMGKAHQDYEKLHKEHTARRASVQTMVDTEVENYRTASKDLSNSKIDPDRYWKRKGTAGLIFSSIAMALGQVGTALAKTPNIAAAMVEKAIDRDISAQMKDLENKKTGLAAQGNIVGMMRQRLGDLEKSEAAAKAHIYAGLEQRMALQASTTREKKVALRATAMQQEFADRRKVLEDQYEIQAIAKAKMLEQQRAMAAAGALAARAKEQQQAALMASLGLPPGATEMDIPKGAKYVHGYGLFLNGDLANKSTEKLQAIKEARTLISGAIGNDKFNFKDRASVEGLLNQLQIKINKAGGLGAMDEGTQKILEGITGDPNAIISLDDPRVKMRQLDRTFQMEHENTVGSAGLIPGQVKVAPNKKGKLRPRFYMSGQVRDYNPSATAVK